MSYFIDSNVLIYSIDNRDTWKHKQARTVLTMLARTESGYISSQVLSEFANVMLRKYSQPKDKVYELIAYYEQVFSVYLLTATIILEAIRGVEQYQLAFYDAQIWATAKLNQIPIVLSEDFNSGSTIENVLFLNPFDKGFELPGGLVDSFV